MSAKDDESPFFCFFGHTAQAVPLVCRIVNVAWRDVFFCFFFSQKRNHLDPAVSGAGKPRETYLHLGTS